MPLSGLLSPSEPPAGSHPLSFAQQRLWFLDQMGAGSALVIPLAMRLSGTLDADVLEWALDTIVRRHATLRSSFPAPSGDAEARVAEAPGVRLERRDLTGLGLAAADRALAIALEESRRPFDLATGPMLRMQLLELGEDDHALLLTTHHIVWDRWSTGILFRELTTLYESGLRGEPAPLPELPMQYPEFAAWQRAWLSGEELERQRSFWLPKLEELEPLDLPLDRPRPAYQAYRSAVVDAPLPDAVVEALRRIGRRRRATLAMVLTAAWKALLARMADTADVAVGVPVANRPRVELEGLIGDFVNTLVLRTELAGDPRFEDELVERVRETSLSAYEHQDLPFEKLVEELGVERDPSRHPVVQTMFSMQNVRRQALRIGEIEVYPLGAERGSPELTQPETLRTAMDLEMRIVEHERGVVARLLYDTALFEEATAGVWLERWQRVLSALASEPGLRLSSLPVLSREEGRLAVAGWREAEERPASERVEVSGSGGSLGSRLLAGVGGLPASGALVAEGRSLGAEELVSRSLDLAWRLRRSGVVRGSVVGLYLERSWQSVVGMAGVTLSGAAWLPLDPSHPQERWGWMLADAGCAAVVTRSGLRGALGGFGGPVLTVEERSEGASEAPPAGRAVGGGDAAYVLYTSGSTGRPKGVVGLHGGAVSRLEWERRSSPWGPGEVGCHKTSPGFVDSVAEVFGPLTSGCRLVVAGEETVRDPEALVSLLAEAGVTRWVLVPSHLASLLESVPELGGRLPRLRRWTVSGEPLSRELAARFFERVSGAHLVNLYGSTEVSADATVEEVTAEGLASSGPGGGVSGARGVPIGRPLPGVRVAVVDRWGRPTVPGAVGELVVGGVGVARGYLGSPGRTAERFVPDALGDGAPGAGRGGRLYRTGDRGRLREDGRFECLGRRDHQVKVRGVRVELGEVEAALASLDGVREAVVSLERRGVGDERLVGWVAARPGTTPAAVLRWARRRLAPAMVPSSVVVLGELPRTPSGKVDRRELPAPGGVATGFRAAPRDGTEEVLCAVFREVLEVDEVGVHDDFFELGGHSLLATRLVSRVRGALQVELDLGTLFRAPTVATLVEAVARKRRRGDLPLRAPIRPVPRDRPLPLSFAQRRLWVLDQMGAGAAYNLRLALRLDGPLDRGALEEALARMVARHEVLSSRFVVVDGEPRQVPEPKAELPLRFVDLSRGPEAAWDEGLAREARLSAEAPFDLGTAPLARATLLRRAEDRHALLLVLHHAVADGGSMEILARDLSNAYAARVEGGSGELPPLPVQYADFAAWQRGRLESGALDGTLAYWRDRLADGTPATEPPTDRPRPAVQTFVGASHRLDLGAERTEALRRLGREHGVTLATVCLAGYQAWLARLTERDVAIVGSPIAGRSARELEEVVGCFANSVVLRTDLTGDPTFAEILRRSHDTVLGAYDHQELSFEKLLEEVRPPRDPSRSPLFQVVFALQGTRRVELEAAGIAVRVLSLPTTTARYDLELYLHDRPGGLRAQLVTNRDLFDGGTARRFLGQLERLLTAAAKAPERRLSRLPLLDDDERRRVLVSFNRPAEGVAPAPPAARSLDEAFRFRVAADPGATALIEEGADGGKMTYGELDARADALAGRLRAEGVGPESRVAVCVRRGMDLPLAMLGVHRAGAAFVPLDPDHPGERLGRSIRESGASLAVVSEGLDDRLPPDLPRLRPPRDGTPTAGTGSPAPAAVSQSGLAYAITTSGSTGRPRTVLVEHRGLANVVRRQAEAFGVSPGTRLLQYASPAFDASIFEVALALAAGGALYHTGPRRTPPGAELHDYLRRHEIEVVTLTPSTLAALPREPLPRLRTVLVAGEACPAPLVDRWAGGRRFFNLYGPTEASIWSTIQELRPGDAPTLGRPIAGTRIHVLDRHLEPCPPGVPGEIMIGGEGVARGYLGRPARTAELFVPDPFGCGGRLFRSGDRGRYRDDGTLEFRGRADRQVKLRGHRIELGEVEAALAGHPEVAACSVELRDLGDGPALVAYWVAPSPSAAEPTATRPTAVDLRESLGRTLPTAFVPARFVLLPELPRTPSGKLDRPALPDPVGAGSSSDVPSGRAEAAVAALWGEILGVDEVGRFDNFFDLGGSSFEALTFLARAERELGLRARPLDVMASTLAQLASRCPPEGARGRLDEWLRRLWGRLTSRGSG